MEHIQISTLNAAKTTGIPANLIQPASYPKPTSSPISLITDTTLPKHSRSGRSPKCGKCCNHGLLVPVKNHKRYCPWRACQCSRCLLTLEHRRKMASKVALKRAIAQDEAWLKELVSQSGRKYLPQRHSTVIEDREEYMNTKIETSLTTTDFQNPDELTGIDRLKVRALMELFCLPDEMLFIIYRTLQEYNGDLERSTAKIFEAQYKRRHWEQLQKPEQRVHFFNESTTEPEFYGFRHV